MSPTFERSAMMKFRSPCSAVNAWPAGDWPAQTIVGVCSDLGRMSASSKEKNSPEKVAVPSLHSARSARTYSAA